MDKNRIFELYLQNSKKEKQYLDYLSNPEYDKETIIAGLSIINVHFAVYHLYLSKDYITSRLCFYRSAAINVYLDRVYDKGTHTSRNFFSTYDGFCYSILSDNQLLIKEIAGFEEEFWKNYVVAFSKALQAILTHNHDELDKQIGFVEKHISKKTWEKNFSGTVNALKGILFHDKTLVENGIDELLLKHKKQNQPAAFKDLFSIEGTTLAKLAVQRGLDININNPLIPNEMLFTEPLLEYEGYGFFNELDFLKK